MVFIQRIRNPVIREVLEWMLHISLAVIIALIITNFILQRTIVNKNSMVPTLNDGDNLIVEKISKKFSYFNDGDIITIYAPDYVKEDGKTIIKRVIATEGETVKIKNGKVYVNDKLIEENYINGDFTRARGEYLDLKVSKGYVYVLGDNRAENILDSRIMGEIPIEDITGKAILRIYPLSCIKFF
jgi:signal peptidase I